MYLDKKGFSLLELIVVVTIVAILAIAGISVYDPSSRMADAHAALRAKASESLEVAIKRTILDNGELPAELAAIATSTPTLLVTTGNPGADTYYCAKLGFEIPKVNIATSIQPLVGSLPIDPALDAASTDTGYFVMRKGNLFDVASCGDVQDCSTCTDNCTGCPTCGNNVIEFGEACDDGDSYKEVCGDGILQVGVYCNYLCTATSTYDEECDYDTWSLDCHDADGWHTSADVGAGLFCDQTTCQSAACKFPIPVES